MSKSLLVLILLILVTSCQNSSESNAPVTAAGSSEEISPCLKKRKQLAFQIDQLIEDTSVVLGDLKSFEVSGYGQKDKKIDSLRTMINTLDCRDESGYGNYTEMESTISEVKHYNWKKYMDAAIKARVGCHDPIISDVATTLDGFENPVKRLVIEIQNGCATQLSSITILVGDSKSPSSCDIIRRLSVKILPWRSGKINVQIKDGCEFKGDVDILEYQKSDGRIEKTGAGLLYQINKAYSRTN